MTQSAVQDVPLGENFMAEKSPIWQGDLEEIASPAEL